MREGGVQVLKDSQNNVQLTVEWLKVPGGHHGGSWAARIKGVPMELSAGYHSIQELIITLMSNFI
jgi:mannosyl-oligosaccharide glucosidase